MEILSINFFELLLLVSKPCSASDLSQLWDSSLVEQLCLQYGVTVHCIFPSDRYEPSCYVCLYNWSHTISYDCQTTKLFGIRFKIWWFDKELMWDQCWCEINVKSFVEEHLQNSASNNTKKHNKKISAGCLESDLIISLDAQNSEIQQSDFFYLLAWNMCSGALWQQTELSVVNHWEHYDQYIN